MKKKTFNIDPSMIVGITAGIALIIIGIGLGNIGHFASARGAVIVFGGTFAALIACFPTESLKKVPKQIWIAIQGALPDPALYIDQIFDCAKVARKHGMLALEGLANAHDDEFMRDSILLIVDAVDANKIRAMLDSDLEYLDERHNEAVTFFERGAALAPAFGLLGTLIGLIIMLANLSLDDSAGNETLTNGMAIALITTFYGIILANLFFTPVASRLSAKHYREMLCKKIIMEGTLSIQAGENPRFIKEKLISFLPQKERRIIEKSAAKKEKMKKDGKKKKKAD